MLKVEHILLFLTLISCNFFWEGFLLLSLAVLTPSLLPEHITCSAHMQHDLKVRLSVFCRDLKSTSTKAGQGSSHCIPSNPSKPGWLGSPTHRRVMSTTLPLWVGAQNVTQDVYSREADPAFFPQLIHSAAYEFSKTLGIRGTSFLSTFWKSGAVFGLAESRKSK